MDLFEIARVLWRRSYVVLPIGAVTLAVALLVQVSTPPEFEAQGWLVMQAPDDPGTENLIDPVLLSEDIKLADEAAFTVSPVRDGQFGVTVSAPTASAAERGVETVIERLGQAIAASQEANGVPEAGRRELRTQSPDVVAEVREDGSYVAHAALYLYSATPVTENPYGFNEGTVSLLQVTVNGQSGRQRFAELAGPGVSFNLGPGDDGGLLSAVTYGSDERQVLEGFHVLRDLADEALDQLQADAGVEPSRRLTIGVADAPLAAEDVSPPVNRAVVGIIALGGLLALGAALGVESLMGRGSTGESSEQDVPTDPATPPDPESSEQDVPTDAATPPDPETAEQGAEAQAPPAPSEPGPVRVTEQEDPSAADAILADDDADPTADRSVERGSDLLA